MGKIKVLQVVQSLDIGGLEKMVVDLIKFFDRERFEFFVCSLSEKSSLADELEGLGVEIAPLNSRRGLEFGLSSKISSFIKDRQIDILHTHNQRPQFYGAIARTLSGVPVYIHTRHSRNDPDNYRNLLIARFCSRFADRIVCVSDAVYRYALEIERIPPDKLVTIRNGVETNAFAGAVIDKQKIRKSLNIGSGVKLVGTVGRLAKVKNQALLIAGFKELLAKEPAAKLLIVGEGPLKKELMGYSCRLEIGDSVVFLGERRDIPELISAMDVFVLPSLSEGMSLVLLEAMAGGLPIVATGVGGNVELVREGENGFLVPVDKPSFLSDAILTILRDPALSQKMSDTNRKRAKNEFDIKAMCAGYQKLYESELDKKK